MQSSRTTEIWVGAFVAIGLFGLFFVAMQVSNLGEFQTEKGSYQVRAHFGNIGGLKVRAPVSMAGVTVGRVEKISFDDSRYEAEVVMRIHPDFKKIPEDTSASILTAGLLGEQYIGLSAGGSDDYLKQGDEIELTQSAMILEQLISRFLFNKAEEGKSEKTAASPKVSAADDLEGASSSVAHAAPAPAPNKKTNLKPQTVSKASEKKTQRLDHAASTKPKADRKSR